MSNESGGFHGSDSADVGLQEHIDSQTTSDWISVEEFQEEANEGLCWILYKGRVTDAYHNHKGKFLFHRGSACGYMAECITGVIPMYPPEPPKDKQ